MRQTLFNTATVAVGVFTPLIEVQIPVDESWRIVKLDAESIACDLIIFRMEHNRRMLADIVMGPHSLSIVYDANLVGGGVLRIIGASLHAQGDIIGVHVMIERTKLGAS